MEGWTKIKGAAEYAGMSPRTIYNWLKNGLTHSRLGTGTILIQYSDIDKYLEKFTCQENEVDRVVNQVLRDFNS